MDSTFPAISFLLHVWAAWEILAEIPSSGPAIGLSIFHFIKNFQISEKLRLQFRIEAFNVFNHTNFLLGDNNISSPSFGIAGGTDAPRNLQLGVKLSY